MPRTKAPLTEKQRKFVRRVLVHGNYTRAAEEAGYASPNVTGPKLVKVSAVKAAIEAGQAKATERDIMERGEALETLSKLSRGQGAKQAKDRIAATALLGKLQGWEPARKLEHSGPGGAPIALQGIPVTREQALDQLRAEAAKNPELAAELKRVTGGAE
jgi:hypothetical protein